jgi:uroporphyrin-3 C-methyltransferase
LEQVLDNHQATGKNNESPLAIAATPGEKKSGPGLGLWLVTLLIAIAGAALSIYLWKIGIQQQDLLLKGSADIAGAIQRVDQQTNNNADLQRQLDQEKDRGLQNQKQFDIKIEGLQQQITGQRKQLLSLSTTDRDDWLLAEAEYLMRLANQRLLMGKEVKGALELLTAADSIVKELDDTGLYPVRQALSENMSALRAAGSLDIEGLYLQLDAAAKQAAKLRLIDMSGLDVVMPEIAPAETWQQRLEFGFQAAWHTLSQYIQINRRDEIYKPLLAPEYEAAVKQNIQLMFEQAQMASLSGKQRLYEKSLDKVIVWLHRYYTLDKSKVDTLIGSVALLSKQKVEISLPDISSSLRSLKSYMETIHNVGPLLESSEITVEESAQ